MKILFYINLIDYGGAERVLVNLANEFSLKNQEVVLVTSSYREKEYELRDKVKRLCLEEKPVAKEEKTLALEKKTVIFREKTKATFIYPKEFN